VIIDGVDAGETPLAEPIVVAAGTHDIVLRYADKEKKSPVSCPLSQTVTVELEVKDDKDPKVPITPPPAEKGEKGSWLVPGVLAGVGVVGLGSGDRPWRGFGVEGRRCGDACARWCVCGPRERGMQRGARWSVFREWSWDGQRNWLRGRWCIPRRGRHQHSDHQTVGGTSAAHHDTSRVRRSHGCRNVLRGREPCLRRLRL
jgi:hypothetical protein